MEVEAMMSFHAVACALGGACHVEIQGEGQIAENWVRLDFLRVHDLFAIFL